MLKRDDATIMFQARSSLTDEIPAFRDRPIGASLVFYLHVAGVKELHDQLQGKMEFVMPWRTSWYGMNEFAVRDLNGYVLMFAEQAQV